MKNVLLVSAGIIHPPFFGRMALHKTLKQLDGFSFGHVSSLEKVPTDLSSFSALVLHYHHKTISSFALGRVDTFVRNGGGILAIHAATASFKETLSYFDILGGRFIGHGKVENIEVVNNDSDVFRDVPNFMVKDELYLHELNENLKIHFTAKYKGENIPVVWTHQYGKGKVFYAVPGHKTGSMNNITYQQILIRGLKWVTE